MDIFDREYPNTSKLYYNYTQTEEYYNNSLVSYIDDEKNKTTDEVITMLSNGEKAAASDSLTHYLCNQEQAGFILGFTYALGLIKETNVLKELAQCT